MTNFFSLLLVYVFLLKYALRFMKKKLMYGIINKDLRTNTLLNICSLEIFR